jgi:Tfp pilus assembly protein PilN
MIEINLLPSHLRKKGSQGGGFLKSVDLPKEIFFGLGSIFIFLLVLIHLGLLSIYFAKLSQLMIRKAEWQKILPDKNRVDAVNQDLKDLNKRLAAINEINSKKAFVWSQKLNLLSDMAPKGVWFKRIVWNGNVFTVEGNAFSKLHDEIAIVNSFVSNLKKEPNFAKDFASIELNSVNRVKKGPTEIADFKIVAKAEADPVATTSTKPKTK